MQVGGLAAAARHPRRCRPDLLAPRLEILELAVQEFVRRSTTLLDVSRMAAGNVRIEPVAVNLNDLDHAVVDRTRVAARMARSASRRICWRAWWAPWDRLALEQVSENLLSNAIKFGAGKPVSIVLASGDRSARLAVRDRGIGISEANRARIFGRFERAVTRREHGGFGFGL